MSSPSTTPPQVPTAALGVAVSAVLMRKGYRNRSSERDIDAIANDLRAAYPHLLTAFKEALLSKEALQAGADAICIEKPATEGERNEVRIEIKAALSTLEDTGSNGG